ncbi:MAG: GGDEF domain-containing protein [Dictyoglomus sp.]|nr:GGDEF domain-containing protein [Dictyoglomus sp.]MCX7942378.1 GGDEF domain-containing protein [Dictyoglomaceae bacterium]MDW8188542.1 diguanylate cyclase [Dictyoglomus sp.]
MNKKIKNVKDVVIFNLFMIFWFVILVFLFSWSFNVDFESFILMSFLVISLIIAYNLGLIEGLIFSLFVILGYGTYIIYNILVTASITDFELKYALWLLVFPIGTYLVGSLRREFDKLKECIEKSKEKEKLILLDEITGFLNASGFFQRLEEEVSRANRILEPLSILYIDISDYKELKNIYGKEGYERILERIAEEINKNTRVIDVKGIIDEFSLGIILPNTDLNSAKIVKEKLHKFLDRISVDFDGKRKIISLKIKIGETQYNLGEDYLIFWERAKENSKYDL